MDAIIKALNNRVNDLIQLINDPATPIQAKRMYKARYPEALEAVRIAEAAKPRRKKRTSKKVD